MQAHNKLYDYRVAVCTLCYNLALIDLITKRLENGELTDAKRLNAVLEKVECYKGKYMDARLALGLSKKGAFEAFTGDFSFFGFSMKHGVFRGDPEKVESITDSFCKFKGLIPTDDEALRYEVGMYAYMSAKGAKELFVEREKELDKPVKKKGFIRTILDKLKNIFRDAIDTTEIVEYINREDDWDSESAA